MNITEMLRLFQSIYGINNTVYTTSLGAKIDILLTKVRKLQESVRKQHNEEKLALELANIIAWTFAVAGHFHEIPIAQAICIKYPAKACGYCGRSPCECPAHNRQKHKEGKPITEQLRWSLREHQQNLLMLYGEVNAKNGLENAILRLFSEVAELSELQVGIAMPDSTASEIQMEYAKELADVFAWTLAIANILNIDVQKIVLATYSSTGCPICMSKPCCCRKLSVVGGKITHIMDKFPQTKPTET